MSRFAEIDAVTIDASKFAAAFDLPFAVLDAAAAAGLAFQPAPLATAFEGWS